MAEATVSGKQSLTAESWMEAALDVIAGGGLQAVAVEPLARRLNVTKGSFYWHFASREALLEAALCRWEKRRYAETAALYEPEVPARERLHRLLKIFANTDQRDERVLMVLSASDNAIARAVEKRVSAHWRRLTLACYRGIGLPEAEASHWSSFAYSVYLGTLYLRKEGAEVLPRGAQYGDYLRFLIRVLMPPEREPQPESADTGG